MFDGFTTNNKHMKSPSSLHIMYLTEFWLCSTNQYLPPVKLTDPWVTHDSSTELAQSFSAS